MLEILQFIFSSVWVFLGFAFLLSLLCVGVKNAIQAARRSDNVTVNNYFHESQVDDDVIAKSLSALERRGRIQ